MSKRKNKKQNDVPISGAVLRVKSFRFVLTYAIAFLIIGAIVGLAIGFLDLPIGTEQKEDNSAAVVESSNLYVELASNEGKQVVSPENVIFNDITLVYDGSPKYIELKTLGEAADLADDFTITYTDMKGNVVEKPTNAGIYTATATINTETHYAVFNAYLTIDKAAIKLDDSITFSDATFVYDGMPHEIKVRGDGADKYTIFYNEQSSATEAGVYDAKATFYLDDNHYTTVLSATLTINKADIDVSDIDFEDTEFDYDGEKQIVSLVFPESALPAGVTYDITYYCNDEVVSSIVNAGTYKVVATFSGKNFNTNTIEANLVVNKVDYDYPEVKLGDITSDYTGKEITAELEQISETVDGFTVSFEYKDENGVVVEKPVNAGKYHVTATLSSTNYKDATLESIITINKVDYDYKVSYTDLKTPYTGSEIMLEVKLPAIVPEGFKVAYENASGINVGTYEAKATLSSINYNDVVLTATLTIEKKTITVDDLKFNDADFVYDGKEKEIAITNLPAGLTATITSDKPILNAGEYVITVSITGDENHNPVSDIKYVCKVSAADIVYNVIFNDRTVTYNGKAFTITPDGVPSDATYVTVIKDENGNVVEEAVNAGKYTVIVTISKTNYKDVTLPEKTLTIKKGYFPMSVNYAQKVNFDFKNHLPEIEVPEGATVTYYLEEAETEGVKTYGKYQFKIVVVDANRESTYQGVELKVVISPIIVIIFAAIGLVLGTIIGLIALGIHNANAKKSRRKLRVVRDTVKKESGEIVFECFARSKGSLRKGRLYFTGSTLEFYSNKFVNDSHKNLVLSADEIRSVNPITSSKIIIYVKNTTYKFRVPVGTARDIRDFIVNR